jgi:hypothetical protein
MWNAFCGWKINILNISKAFLSREENVY